MKLNVVGCSPAWPNPGGAQSGYLLEGPGRLLMDCGPGVLARLRSSSNGTGWPHVDAIAITHFHLDHWGDLVPWVWGTMWGLGRRLCEAGAVASARGHRGASRVRDAVRTPDMFSRVFEPKEYAEGEEFEAAGLKLVADQASALHGADVRVPRLEHDADARVLGRLGPSDRLAELAEGVDLFLCEATLERGELDGEPRGHLSAEEAVAAFEASGAKRLLLTHRPDELTLDAGLEQAYDGLQLDV